MARRAKLNNLNTSDTERLWQAMVAISPTTVKDGTRHKPRYAAQLARESAEALLEEFQHATRRAR